MSTQLIQLKKKMNKGSRRSRTIDREGIPDRYSHVGFFNG